MAKIHHLQDTHSTYPLSSYNESCKFMEEARLIKLFLHACYCILFILKLLDGDICAYSHGYGHSTYPPPFKKDFKGFFNICISSFSSKTLSDIKFVLTKRKYTNNCKNHKDFGDF